MDHIRTNRLASGERLPSEVRLSAELKISRGIVREAYRALRSAGILEISNGRSPRVGALRSTALTHLVQHALSTQQASPEQALDLRAAIEVRAAGLAAEKRSAADIEVLTRALRGMKRARRDIDAFVQHDVRFHECLGAATGNPLFALISSALREAMATSVRAGMESRTDQAQVLRVVESHQDIGDAVRAGRVVRLRTNYTNAVRVRRLDDRVVISCDPYRFRTARGRAFGNAHDHRFAADVRQRLRRQPR